MMQKTNHLKSIEVQKKLKIGACDLMHLRMAGKLRFQKVGNAFIYDANDVLLLEKKDEK